MILKSKILGAEELGKVDLINNDLKRVEGYFNCEPIKVEILNSIYMDSCKVQGLELRSLTVNNYIQIIINKELNIIYSYIKRRGAWEELDKEQAKQILYKIFLALGKERQQQEKECNIL